MGIILITRENNESRSEGEKRRIEENETRSIYVENQLMPLLFEQIRDLSITTLC